MAGDLAERGAEILEGSEMREYGMRTPMMISSSATSLRAALASDCGSLSRIARAAKAHWGYPAAWLDAWRPELTITARTLEEIGIVLAETESSVVGFYGLSIDGAKAGLEHLWVDPEHMRRGVGRALFRHAMGAARECAAEILEIESDPFAEPFYRRMGAVPAGTVARPMCGQARELPVLRLVLDAGGFRETTRTEQDS